MGDISGLVVLFFAAAIIDMVVKALRRQAEARRTPPMETPDRPPEEAWRQVLVQADRIIGRSADRALEPGEEEDEEATSLEVMPEVTSLETGVERAPRAVVDLDEESAFAAERRMREAAARNRPHTRADHRAFDEKVRHVAPPSSPRPVLTRERMREAVKWREILDRPVGWRDDD